MLVTLLDLVDGLSGVDEPLCAGITRERVFPDVKNTCVVTPYGAKTPSGRNRDAALPSWAQEGIQKS